MSNLKGTYTLNPTKAIMKQGSAEYRNAEAGSGAVGKPKGAPKSELEENAHEFEHPMMKTRQAHPAEHKHADGRKHEDHHHAVKKLKGE